MALNREYCPEGTRKGVKRRREKENLPSSSLSFAPFAPSRFKEKRRGFGPSVRACAV
jgi:hypothetical protein